MKRFLFALFAVLFFTVSPANAVVYYDPPEGVHAFALKDTRIEVIWLANDDDSIRYQVKYSTHRNFNDAKYRNSKVGVSTVILKVKKHKRYYIKVRIVHPETRKPLSIYSETIHLYSHRGNYNGS